MPDEVIKAIEVVQRWQHDGGLISESPAQEVLQLMIELSDRLGGE